MPKVSDIAAYLDREIPFSLKMDFDNVGLLCGFPGKEVSRILVVLDVTLEAVREAERIGAELIVAHHPVIFTPMKTVTDDTPEGRRVIALLRSGISAVCLHTNLDRAEGGVNTALARALGAEELIRLDMGSVCELPDCVPLPEFLSAAADSLGVRDIRWSDAGRTVRRIALCGGSGGDIIYDAVKYGCDTVVTGEIRHHQWIDGGEMGLNLIEAGHFATENPVTGPLAELIRRGFPEVDVRSSGLQRSPTTGFSI